MVFMRLRLGLLEQDSTKILCFGEHSLSGSYYMVLNFFVDMPSSLVHQSITYSSYKSHNTFKLLVGISPTGVVTFVSKLWGGNLTSKLLKRVVY